MQNCYEISDDLLFETKAKDANFKFHSGFKLSPMLISKKNSKIKHQVQNLTDSFILSPINKHQHQPLLLKPNHQNNHRFSETNSSSQSKSSSFITSNMKKSFPRQRRLSYHFGQINSILQPVQESRPISPLYPQQQYQIDDLEHKFKTLFTSSNNQDKKISPNTIFDNNPKKRARAISIGSTTLKNTISNNMDLNNNLTFDTNTYQSKSLSNLNNSFGILDDKAAKTGNMFQKRDDWSIIHKLPVNKQNTINMKLEDEGPFGNDEIRFFVLSHFSSIGVKELTCLLCDVNLIIYDMFPLIDGTLFISPFNYDPKKAISTKLNSQSAQQELHQLIGKHIEDPQYLFAICLKCLIKQDENDIKCKYCSKSWLEMGGTTLQIGTLYKYDIFAAFPCCQTRLNCNRCNNHLICINEGSSHYFSSYSKEHECYSCKTKAYHFIKPLKDIFQL